MKQVEALLTLQDDKDASCAEVSEMAANHLEDIEAKIHDLEHMKKALIPLVEACPKKGALTACPIMDSLERDG